MLDELGKKQAQMEDYKPDAAIWKHPGVAATGLTVTTAPSVASSFAANTLMFARN